MPTLKGVFRRATRRVVCVRKLARPTRARDGGECCRLETASGGLFGSDPQLAFERWQELRAWAGAAGLEGRAYDEALLEAPVPRSVRCSASA